MVENTTFKSEFAQKIQKTYHRNLSEPEVYDKKASRISKVETVIRLGGQNMSFNRKGGPRREQAFSKYEILKDYQVHILLCMLYV